MLTSKWQIFLLRLQEEEMSTERLRDSPQATQQPLPIQARDHSSSWLSQREVLALLGPGPDGEGGWSERVKLHPGPPKFLT